MCSCACILDHPLLPGCGQNYLSVVRLQYLVLAVDFLLQVWGKKEIKVWMSIRRTALPFSL